MELQFSKGKIIGHRQDSGTVGPGLPLSDPRPLSGGGVLSNHRGLPPLYKRLSKRAELRL